MKNLEIKAKVYVVKLGTTALKAFANVDIGGLLFINSYVISNTVDRPDKIVVFPPSARMKAGNFKPYIEFPNPSHNILMAAIYKACLSAYKKYEDTKRLHQYGDVFVVELDRLVSADNPTPSNANNTANDDIIEDFDMSKELEKVKYIS